jgi:hypothetical protein
MKKTEEIRTPTSCFNKARDDERMFVLLARDVCAPAAIRFWANERIRCGKNVATDPQIVEAFDCASAMERERGK